MNYGFSLFATILVPLAGSLFLPLAGKFSARLRDLAALGLSLAALFFSSSLLPLVFSGGTLDISLPQPLGMTRLFHADTLAVFTAMASALVSSVIVLFSFDYISHYENQGEYYFLVALFLGAMMGLVFSANLILLYVFWEITAIASWRLIGFFRGARELERADKAFLVTFFGATVMLAGFLLVFQRTGSFDLKAHAAIPGLAVALILFGIFSKSATLPFHTWLPDAGVAPSPVTALLHAAILVKIGVYVFARLFLATYTVPGEWMRAVSWTAAASALVSAGAALKETDLKRIIAYSTISQIGFIFFGFASGTFPGAAGGLLYILMHGLAKSGLFLCAGIIEQKMKTRDIRQLGGLLGAMPLTGMSFLLCAFSVMGLPPFGGFFSKYLVFAGAVEAGQLGTAFVFLAGACLTMAYLLRVFNAVFLGEQRTPAVAEGSRLMVACVASLAVLSLAGGILINFPYDICLTAARQMLAHLP